MTMTDQFEAGQIWRTRGRPQDGDAYILILAVMDDTVVGRVYSVAMTGVRIRNPGFEGGVQTMLPHAPVTDEVLRADATELVSSDGPTADHPDFSESYLHFRELYDEGDAGVFTISLAEILDLVEQSVASVQS
jgi:hypothetical protein